MPCKMADISLTAFLPSAATTVMRTTYLDVPKNFPQAEEEEGETAQYHVALPPFSNFL